MSGQKVNTLINGKTTAGSHAIPVYFSHLSSGISFVRLTSPTGIQTQKIDFS